MMMTLYPMDRLFSIIKPRLILPKGDAWPQRWAKWRLSTWGGGGMGCRDKYATSWHQLAMNRFLPLLATQISTLWIHKSEGAGGSDIRSMSSIRPICKCRCPPLRGRPLPEAPAGAAAWTFVWLIIGPNGPWPLIELWCCSPHPTPRKQLSSVLTSWICIVLASVVDPDWIRIQWGPWIRIRIRIQGGTKV